MIVGGTSSATAAPLMQRGDRCTLGGEYTKEIAVGSCGKHEASHEIAVPRLSDLASKKLSQRHVAALVAVVRSRNMATATGLITKTVKVPVVEPRCETIEGDALKQPTGIYVDEESEKVGVNGDTRVKERKKGGGRKRGKRERDRKR